jgi:hypothetical protein
MARLGPIGEVHAAAALPSVMVAAKAQLATRALPLIPLNISAAGSIREPLNSVLGICGQGSQGKSLH